ncbi:MAG: Ig-like protein [Ignavibacteria bacterium]|nr:Ig-like protein [Ignavibacteria bacterium]
MKLKQILLNLQIILFMVILSGCQKNDGPTGNEPETAPSIKSIDANKTQILYGGMDEAIITCNASGGNLKFVWQVDLGDLVPLNNERSKVSYTGAACCVGDKIITCTVSNSKGSVSKSITVTILEVIKQPEIITIESDKTEIQSGSAEKANIVCYAIGGNLKYAWKVVDCGDITVNESDNTKITYSAPQNCVGTKTIKCTVSNEKGSFSDSIQMTVK